MVCVSVRPLMQIPSHTTNLLHLYCDQSAVSKYPYWREEKFPLRKQSYFYFAVQGLEAIDTVLLSHVLLKLAKILTNVRCVLFFKSFSDNVFVNINDNYSFLCLMGFFNSNVSVLIKFVKLFVTLVFV